MGEPVGEAFAAVEAAPACRGARPDGALFPTDVNQVNRLGWTALLEAVILGDGGLAHQQIVEILLAAGADPLLPDGDGVTARGHAERRGFRAMADTLRAAEAGLTPKNCP